MTLSFAAFKSLLQSPRFIAGINILMLADLYYIINIIFVFMARPLKKR